MGDKHNVRLPLLCPLLGTWPTIQACALTGNGTSHPCLGSQAGAQSTEPHQPELFLLIYSKERNTNVHDKIYRTAHK